MGISQQWLEDYLFESARRYDLHDRKNRLKYKDLFHVSFLRALPFRGVNWPERSN